MERIPGHRLTNPKCCHTIQNMEFQSAYSPPPPPCMPPRRLFENRLNTNKQKQNLGMLYVCMLLLTTCREYLEIRARLHRYQNPNQNHRQTHAQQRFVVSRYTTTPTDLKAGRSPLPTRATRLELNSISARPIPPSVMAKHCAKGRQV